MARSNPAFHIGIAASPVQGWAAASSYAKMLILSLGKASSEAAAQLTVISNSDEFDDTTARASGSIKRLNKNNSPTRRTAWGAVRHWSESLSFPGHIRVKHVLRISSPSDVFIAARKVHADVILPVLDMPPWKVGVSTIGWIPDFQHLHLPEFFTEAEVSKRVSTSLRLTDRASLILLSSRAAAADYLKLNGARGDKVRIHPFPSLFAFEPPASDPGYVRAKYNIPVKFVLVANQFWAHKNHQAILQAASTIFRANCDIPFVLVGLPTDPRDPSNAYMSSVLQAVAREGLRDRVILLGSVPRPDLEALLRCACVVVQPSKFEGWNTTVQDAKALGRPLICSDLPVHREQVPNALAFFPPEEPAVLAAALISRWNELPAGPDAECEVRNIRMEQSFASNHGRELLQTCREAAGLGWTA